MNLDQYNQLQNNKINPVIKVSDLQNKKDRTLIYGYNTDRNTFHLYLKDYKFHIVLYEYNNTILKPNILITDEISPFNTYPSKRVYPECCDYEFSELVIQYTDLPFTTFNSERLPSIFYGKLLEELTIREPIKGDQYYKSHTHCIECCNKVDYALTTIVKETEYDFYDAVNSFLCNCGNTGMISNLISEQGAENFKKFKDNYKS